MIRAAPTGPDPTHLHAVYTFGIFSMALIDVFVFLIPVYAGITLGMSDSEIGMLVGARSFLSLFLSIHSGVLMDRFGTLDINVGDHLARKRVGTLLPTHRSRPQPKQAVSLVRQGGYSLGIPGEGAD